MSYYDEQDLPEIKILSVTTHTARIQHVCDACGKTINPGQQYDKTVMTYDGEFCEQKRHASIRACWGSDEEYEAMSAF